MRKRQDSPTRFSQTRNHFLPLLRDFRGTLTLAVLAMVTDAILTVMRPWPLKIVIDNVLHHRTMPRLASLGHWLTASGFSKMHILYGCCAATLLIALSTGRGCAFC